MKTKVKIIKKEPRKCKGCKDILDSTNRSGYCYRCYQKEYRKKNKSNQRRYNRKYGKSIKGKARKKRYRKLENTKVYFRNYNKALFILRGKHKKEFRDIFNKFTEEKEIKKQKGREE